MLAHVACLSCPCKRIDFTSEYDKFLKADYCFGVNSNVLINKGYNYQEIGLGLAKIGLTNIT